jgi:hypothetical protein
MPAIRRKDASIAKIPQIKKNGEDYDDAILKLNTKNRQTSLYVPRSSLS